ncbi:MAG: hypothetical protein K2J67_12815, partial [Lachnospiraceae bacterium]|nr:hypothetical protein [Lachnospiraceae bacterium]
TSVSELGETIEATGQPDGSSKPLSTYIPDTADTPEGTDMPQPSGTPMITGTPMPTNVPGKTNPPAATRKPAPTPTPQGWNKTAKGKKYYILKNGKRAKVIKPLMVMVIILIIRDMLLPNSGSM